MSTATTPGQRAAVWRGALLWTAGVAGLGVLYRDLFHQWYRALLAAPDETLGFVVPPLVVYLVWRRRARLAATPARASVAGGVAFIAAVGLIALGNLVWIATVARFGFWCALGVLAWAAWGPSWMRVLAMPFAFLFFAQPLPVTAADILTLPLRLCVTENAATLLSLGGLPTIADGVLLHMPAATLETTQACSGIRGFVAAVALALLIAELLPGPLRTTALLFPGALAVAYVLNVVRVMLEALWTAASGGPSADWLHASFGLLTFAGVSALLILWQLRTSAASA